MVNVDNDSTNSFFSLYNFKKKSIYNVGTKYIVNYNVY